MELEVKRRQGHPWPRGTALEQQLFTADTVNKITDFFHQKERRKKKEANFHFSGSLLTSILFRSNINHSFYQMGQKCKAMRMGNTRNLKLLALKVIRWSCFCGNSSCHKNFCQEDLGTKLRMLRKFRFSFFFRPGNRTGRKCISSYSLVPSPMQKPNVAEGSWMFMLEESSLGWLAEQSECK